jgi:hypothetical protein
MNKKSSLCDQNVKHDTAAKWENLLACVPVLNCYLPLTGINNERSQLQYIPVNGKEDQSTGTFNSLMFHTTLVSPVYLTRFLTFPWRCRSPSVIGGRGHAAKVSATVCGETQLFTVIHFNTAFSSCFTKIRKWKKFDLHCMPKYRYEWLVSTLDWRCCSMESKQFRIYF